MGIRPDRVKPRFDANDVWTQAHILAYSQIRELEEIEMAKMMVPRFAI